MRKITLLLCLGVFSFSFSQEAELKAQEELKTEKTPLTYAAVLNKLKSGKTLDNLSMAELQLYKGENAFRNAMATIIPTAGATESFAVAAGDTFFDPGGAGGGETDGVSGNYPNCGCLTTTTLTGVEEINFIYFSVFSDFDWLKVYDGADNTGTLLYDSTTISGNLSVADIVSETGSSMFTSTSGNLTFEFNSTTVVDRGGWEVEIVSVLGLEDITFSKFEMLPNPVESVLKISNNKVIDKVEIYSILGKKVFESSFNNTKVELQLSHLAGGNYILKAYSNNRTVARKLIKK